MIVQAAKPKVDFFTTASFKHVVEGVLLLLKTATGFDWKMHGITKSNRKTNEGVDNFLGAKLYPQDSTKPFVADLYVSMITSPPGYTPVRVRYRAGLTIEREMRSVFDEHHDSHDFAGLSSWLTTLHIPQIAAPVIARLLQAARLLLAEERTAIIRKEKGKWVVRSPHNPSWSGGAFDTKEEAVKRLQQCEGFKHRGGSVLTAALADDLSSQMRDLLAQPLNVAASRAVAAFLADNFTFQVSRTPSGQKALKEAVSSLHWWLQHGVGQYRDNPEAARTSIEHAWGQVEPHLADLVRSFSLEGGRNVPKEIVVGTNTYVNLVGFPEPQLRKYAESLEKVFHELRGWRTKALVGGLRVVLAGPRDFRGTASGTYRSAEDALYVRATPNVLKRTSGTYGSFDYIIVHELGHRYQAKHRSLDIDFDRQDWHTSRYSLKDGESFAELFALSNFGIQGYGKPETLERFEDLMVGRSDQPNRELPEHLRNLR